MFREKKQVDVRVYCENKYPNGTYRYIQYVFTEEIQQQQQQQVSYIGIGKFAAVGT